MKCTGDVMGFSGRFEHVVSGPVLVKGLGSVLIWRSWVKSLDICSLILRVNTYLGLCIFTFILSVFPQTPSTLHSEL